MRRAEKDLTDRLEWLESLTAAALDVSAVEDLLRDSLDRIRIELEVDTAAVLLLDGAGTHLVTIVSRGFEESARLRTRVPVGQGFAGTIAADRRPLIFNSDASSHVINPILRNSGVRSLLGVPLLAGDRLLGVLHVGSFSDERFDESDLRLLTRVAGQISLATQARLSAEERAAAAALQRSLVPSQLPAIPGFDLAARYIPGEGMVSGDWYDVFVLPSGAVGIVMGDVAGHGLASSVVMGRLRSALRAYALEHRDPADVLEHLDRKVCHFEAGSLTTAVYAVVPPPFDRLQISCAGHLPPFVVGPDSPAGPVDVPVDLPLGVEPDTRRRTTTLSLPKGSSVALFTDGLIERRSPSTPQGAQVFDQLEHALGVLADAFHPGDADAACYHIVERLLASEAPDDDVALLVLHRRPA